MQLTNKIFPLVATVLTVSSVSQLQAQQRNVQGKVTDATTGKALAGVNVVFTGQTRGTTTNLNGEFTLPVQQVTDATIEFSYIGYESQRVKADGSNLTVALQVTSQNLDEVVVVAYGTSKRANITGSVSTINAKSN
ncbi:carboxypeptidase-like regulatory domain-containing protein [Sphingobacterium sp. JUb56]|uniref:carboxypeptidase-like regulatory domain-containing protein n=1 Tax=Sphingobacterium sp. JUb56 TaxID=2587145 RepID=UPI0017DAED79|nr:carboxypeptidase-like regulatory domain-containing protein [Sphingobacterium sp. JUb56]MBB2949269.1 hypothetical protein [Sphingobacterium sp. JUb56]